MAYKGAGGGSGFSMHIDPANMKATLLAYRNLKVTEKEAALMAVTAAGAVLKTAVKKNLSRNDFSINQLAALDHPFAKRHGSIQSNKLGGSWQRRPYMAHKRSGKLHDSIYGRRVSGSGATYEVGADIGKARHIKYVIEGTTIMLPRDVIYRTAMEDSVKKKMRVAIIRVFGGKLRSQAAIRFG